MKELFVRRGSANTTPQLIAQDGRRTLTAVLLGCLFIISICLHVFRIDHPSSPVFDEAHFATYAANYSAGELFYDIHPPLGKLFYADVLSLSQSKDAASAQFITVEREEDGTLRRVAVSDKSFNGFPYVHLRMLSVFFGVLLPFLFFGLLRSIGADRLTSLLAAFLLIFENALLLQTRLILLDGMYLFFGVAALWLYFSSQGKFSIASGVLWGLALSVKLIGVVFLGPILVLWAIRKRGKSASVLQFALAGVAVLFVCISVNNILYAPEARNAYWSSLGFFVFPQESYLSASLTELSYSVLQYTGYGGWVPAGQGPQSSPWYLWPLMQRPIDYFRAPEGSIIFSGNAVIWYMSTLSVIVAFGILLFRFFRRRRGGSLMLPLLLGGYVTSIAPFIFLIERPTYLYHALPSLLFAVGILALSLSAFMRWCQNEKKDRFGSIVIGVVILCVLGGFLMSASKTYGL